MNLPRHPSQLYEAFGEGLLLGLLMWFVLRPRRPFKGFQIGVYLIGYGMIRFVIEYARQPDQGIDLPIRLVAGRQPRLPVAHAVELHAPGRSSAS